MFNWSQLTAWEVDPLQEEDILMSPSKHLIPLMFYISFRSLPNVPLADKDTGMVDTLSKAKLEHLCLQPPLQEVFNLQTQDVIELHLTLIQHTDSHKTSQQGIT